MPRSVLVVGPAWVGDMVLAHSLFQLLKRREPDLRLAVAAPPWTAAVTERMPEVDDRIVLPFPHGMLALRARWQLGASLRDYRFDQAIVLPRALKAALLPFAARARRRTGFRGEMRYGLLNDIRPLDRTRLPRTVDRFVALGLEPGEAFDAAGLVQDPKLRHDPGHGAATLRRLGLAAPQGAVLGLCPGAEYGPAKRWPMEHYAAIARAAAARGQAVWLFGSQKDLAVTEEVQRRSGNVCVDLGGKTGLLEAVDLLGLCDAVVTNDSGLMHVAAALGRRTLALYGSSDPRHTPPMSPKAEVLTLGLACSPCFKRVCPLGHTRCLMDLPPARVAAALGLDR